MGLNVIQSQIERIEYSDIATDKLTIEKTDSGAVAFRLYDDTDKLLISVHVAQQDVAAFVEALNQLVSQ